MAKITLSKPVSGYNLAEINNNFTLIEAEFQNKVLYRNNPVGEANQLETDIDANSKRLYNLPEPLLQGEAARLQDVQNALAGGSANLVAFTPYLNVQATSVQGAIQEIIDDLNWGTVNAFQFLTSAQIADVKARTSLIDVSAGLQAWLSSGATRLEIDAGVYKVNAALAKTLTNGKLEIIANGDVAIDGSTAPAGSTLMTVSGTVGASAALNADVAFQANTLSTNLAVVAGDVIEINSTVLWSLVRPAYTKGELVEVKSVSGTTVTLKAGLWDSYTAATTTLTKIQAPDVTVRGLKFLRPASDVTTQNNGGLSLQYCRNALVEKVSSEFNNYFGIEVKKCLGVDVFQGVTRGSFVVGQGLDYGLLINSSQRVRVYGGDYIAGRHGITHGGTFPCRDILVNGAFVDNDPVSQVLSFDSHENCQDLRVISSTFGNGGFIGAIDCVIQGNTVRTKVSGGVSDVDSLLVSIGRTASYVKILGNNIQSSATKRGIRFKNSQDSGAINLRLLELKDNYIATTDVNGAVVTTSGVVGDALTVTRMVLNGNDAQVFGAASIGLQIQGSTGTLTIGTLDLLGGSFTSANYQPINIGSSFTVIGRTRIGGVTFTANEAADLTGSLNFAAASGPVEIVGNTMLGGNYFFVDGYSTAKIADNTFKDGQFSFGTLGATANFTNLLVSNNTDINNGGAIGMTAGVFPDAMRSVGNGTATYRTALKSAMPTTGSWRIGDRVLNSAPTNAAGQVAGWLRVTTGSGNVLNTDWRAFGVTI